ncbi:MAG: hypothetical protein LIO71_04675 [Ruminococcus sp.]|nr:hypothetical protein [Ruminococcus sp.]
MRKETNDFIIASILYKLMQGTPIYEVADKYRLSYDTISKWEREHSTLWVLRTLKEGGIKV